VENCVFCQRDNLIIVAENKLAIAFYDGCPVNEGHILITPKRHVETYFDTSLEEHTAMVELIFKTKEYLQLKYEPDGFNIGSNVGLAAGQTVFHFHIHVIPRYSGDVPDPRGGVRKVIPHRGSELKSSGKNNLH